MNVCIFRYYVFAQSDICYKNLIFAVLCTFLPVILFLVCDIAFIFLILIILNFNTSRLLVPLESSRAKFKFIGRGQRLNFCSVWEINISNQNKCLLGAIKIQERSSDLPPFLYMFFFSFITLVVLYFHFICSICYSLEFD